MFKTWTKTGTSTCYQKEMTLASNVALDFRKFPNFLSHFHIVWKFLNRIGAFSSIFVSLKVTSMVNLFDCKHQVFKNSSKVTVLGIFVHLKM